MFSIRVNDSLLDEVGLDWLPPAARRKTLTALGCVVGVRVLWRTVPAFPIAVRAVLQRLYNADDHDAMLHSLASQVPWLNTIVDEELAKLKSQLLAIVAIETTLADAESYYGDEFERLDRLVRGDEETEGAE